MQCRSCIIPHLTTGDEGLLKLLVVVRSPRRAQPGGCINLLAARKYRSNIACLPLNCSDYDDDPSSLRRLLAADPVHATAVEAAS